MSCHGVVPAHRHRAARSGLSLLELLAVIAVLAVLLAILLPVLSVSRAKARTATCTANLRQIGAALAMYVVDHDGVYPPVTTAVYENGKADAKGTKDWRELILPYIRGGEEKAYPFCPERIVPEPWPPALLRGPDASGYALNPTLSEMLSLSPTKTAVAGEHETRLRYPAVVITVFDARVQTLAMNGPDDERDADESAFDAAQPLGATRHWGGANYAFADGHVRWLKPSQIGNQRDQPGDGVHPGFGL